jgi:hypothetical protein
MRQDYSKDYSGTSAHPPEELAAPAQSGTDSRLLSKNLLGDLDDIKARQDQAENITEELEKILYELGLALNNLDSAVRRNSLEHPRMQSIFNLSNLVRSTHAETLPLAESKGIALSWFVSPNLPLLYKGDEDSLKSALVCLLKGAAEYAESGVIQLTVRPDAERGGDFVQFSLTDNSIKPQSARRPAKILSRAWELARASQGSFSINFLPDRGTSINFTLKLQALQDKDNVWASEKKAAGQVAASQTANGDSFPDLSDIDISREEAAAETPARYEPEESLVPEAEKQAAAGVEEEPGIEISEQSEPAAVPASIAGTADFEELELALREKPDDAPDPGWPARDTIIVADLTTSGRRLMARHLGDLPHFRLEARNAGEIIQGCAWGNVCLIIFDADMPENDIKNALLEVNAGEARAGRPPVPSLGLLSHISQSARMRKIGCTECQVKTASQESFRELVLKLAPLPARKEQPAPAREAEQENAGNAPQPLEQAQALLPEQVQKQVQEQPATDKNTPENRKDEQAKPDRSVPLLDLIVYDEEDTPPEFPDPLDQATKLAAERTAARAAEKKR